MNLQGDLRTRKKRMSISDAVPRNSKYIRVGQQWIAEVTQNDSIGLFHEIAVEIHLRRDTGMIVTHVSCDAYR